MLLVMWYLVLIVVLVDLGSMGMGRGKEFEILEERGGGYSLVVLGGTLFVLIVLEIEGWRGERVGRKGMNGLCLHRHRRLDGTTLM